MSRDAGPARDVQATLDAWRDRGADRLDPVRFDFIAALARRAAGRGGETRRILDGRLAGLIAAYGDDLARADAAGEAAPPSAAPGRGPLAGLLDDIAARPRARGDAYPELEALEYFRETWSRIRADRQVRQSLGKTPGNTGPLNSAFLAHRALERMHALSPGYLRRFLGYLDTLSWMEQLTATQRPKAAKKS